MNNKDYYEINIEEIEKYIIGKKIKDMSLEEIKNWIEIQSQLIIFKDYIIEKKYDVINKVKKYIEGNFTNQDGTIWHSEMQNIYNILNNKDN